MLDPFRLSIICVPLITYFLWLGWMNLGSRPRLISGTLDTTLLCFAMTGLAFVGPLEMFRPEAATTFFQNYIWLFLLSTYWLWSLLAILLTRPRLVVYNATPETLRPILKRTVERLDTKTEIAGEQYLLQAAEIQFHLDAYGFMNNVSLVSSGGKQNYLGWDLLKKGLQEELKTEPQNETQIENTEPNKVTNKAVSVGSRVAVGWFLAAAVLIFFTGSQVMNHPKDFAQGKQQIFSYSR